MDMQKMEQSQSAMYRLNNAVEELIRVVQQQKMEFNTQLIEQKNLLQIAENKVAVSEAQIKTLTDENEKLRVQIIAAQNNTDMQNKLQMLQSEIDAKAGKISGLQTEVQNLNTALNNRKAQIEELNRKNAELTEQVFAFETKINELESNSAHEDNIATQMQMRLDELTMQNEAMQKQSEQNEERMVQMQQTISQTSESIDEVIAKLEEVLKENGTSNNNN